MERTAIFILTFSRKVHVLLKDIKSKWNCKKSDALCASLDIGNTWDSVE